MQYIIFTSDNGDIDWAAETDELKNEAGYVWKLHKENILKNIWFTENKDAILIIEAENLEAAAAIAEGLPLVKKQLLKYTINSLHPYTGFERLFNGAN